MVYECGASLDIKNRQNLTPLTLSAKLAMKDVRALFIYSLFTLLNIISNVSL